MTTILADAIGVSCCGLWILALVYMWRSIRRLPILSDVVPAGEPQGGEWPTVCAIVPACNEAANLKAALSSLLRQNYPRLDIVVVDDRSTDATPRIIKQITATDRRARYIRIDSLPDGWLGKVHALHCGVQQAHADWYLFIDADVHLEPEMLKSAINYARQSRLTHLTCVPAIMTSAAFWLDVTIRAFFLMFCAATRLASVNRPDSKWPLGIGAFNLVEARIFRRTPGFEWLRMEPADDMGLGAMVKNAGARTGVVRSDSMLSVSWYTSLREMFRGLEKNSFGPAANYRYSRQLAIVAVLWLFALGPVLSFLVGLGLADPILVSAGGLALAATVVLAILMPRHSTREILAFLLLPAGVLIMSAIMLRAAFRCSQNGGIDWRGTRYSVADLRAGQRVKF